MGHRLGSSPRALQQNMPTSLTFNVILLVIILITFTLEMAPDARSSPFWPSESPFLATDASFPWESSLISVASSPFVTPLEAAFGRTLATEYPLFASTVDSDLGA